MGVKSIAQPIDAITFGASSVPFAGSDPKLVGYLFGCKLNTISKPFVSREGVHVLFVESIVKQQLPTTLSTRKGTLYSETKGRIYENILNSLKKSEDVKDFRFKFY